MVIYCPGFHQLTLTDQLIPLTFYDIIGSNIYLCPVGDHYVIETWGNENFRF
jgi:hypothetical protein